MTFLVCIAICLITFPVSAKAADVHDDPLLHSGYAREQMLRGEYEKGLEHLRRAYLLFPLNTTLKRNLAEGYGAFANKLLKQKRYEEADENILKAIELFPEEPAFALLRGICAFNTKKFDVARYELERARILKPDAPEIFYYLGLALYDSDNREQAIGIWETALAKSPGHKEIQEQLSRARREMGVEAAMERGYSSRFDITFDPGVNTAVARSLLDVLETAANQIGADLGYFPESRIPVAVYVREDFRKLTNAPIWSGGVFDGRIRLPFGSAVEITPQIREVLYHEYAHAVVYDMTRGNTPLWLNEGIAEFFGRLQYNRPLPDLARAARAGTLPELRKLEGSFTALTTAEAALAYQQSYAVVNYLVTTFGWHRIKTLLTTLGKGMKLDEAIAESFREYTLDYDGLQKEWRISLEKGLQSAR